MTDSDRRLPSNRFVLFQALFALPAIIGGALLLIGAFVLYEDGLRAIAEGGFFIAIGTPFATFGGLGIYRLHMRHGRGERADELHPAIRSRSGAVNIAVGGLLCGTGVVLALYLYFHRREFELATFVLAAVGSFELLYGVWQLMRRTSTRKAPGSE